MIEHPTKIFPCDCMGEGLVVTKQAGEIDDCEGAPFIDIGFWQFGHETMKKYTAGGLWWRLKFAWRVFREGMPFADMVTMQAKHAKNLAHHILYVIEKDKERKKHQDYLVKEIAMFPSKLPLHHTSFTQPFDQRS